MWLSVLCVVALGVFFGQRTVLSQSERGTQGAGGKGVNPLIADGKIAPTGRFPYMCSLRYQGSHEHFCGATLILPRWILTAAHCIDTGENNAPLLPIVYCGIDKLDETDPDLMFGVRRSHMHPDWVRGKEHHGYDIAMLNLDRNASLALEHLPELDTEYNRFDSSDSLTALGWGKTSSLGHSNELRMAEGMQFVPSDTCNERWWGGRINEDRMICAGLDTENVCRGDSGGPLIRPDDLQGNLDLGKTSNDLIVGVTSFNYESDRCGKQGRPAVFTKVAYFVDWISDVIGEDVTKVRTAGQSTGSLFGPESGLSRRVPGELVKEMTKAFKSDNDVRAKRILNHLHVNETLLVTIRDIGLSRIPLLHAAAMFNAPKCAQALIDDGASVNSWTSDYYRMKPLHVCAIFGSLKVAKVLLSRKNGASVNTRDSVDDTAMHKAATRGHVDLLEFLIDKTPSNSLFPVNDAGDSPLHEAARAGQLAAVKLLLKRGADVNYRGDNYATPLHLASFFNHTDVAKVLLEHGADVDAGDRARETALHKACDRGNDEVVRVLLRNLADMYSRDTRGWTAVHRAIWNGHIKAVVLMIRNGVSPNAANSNGYSVLHSASFAGYTHIAEFLIEQGASVDAADNSGNTPVSLAVWYGHFNMVKLLISKGARVDAYRDNVGETLLHEASINGDVDIAKVLLRNGADVHATDSQGETPLHEAAEYGQYEVVKVLLEAGALKNVVDENGDTPSDDACRSRSSCGASTESALRFILEP